jgi:hypothetical protein
LEVHFVGLNNRTTIFWIKKDLKEKMKIYRIKNYSLIKGQYQAKIKRRFMRYFILAVTTCVIVACNQSSTSEQQLQVKIDSLQKQLSETYKPGFGEFMSGIQVHHAKLWFAGQNQNWPLADFEVHEILETLDDLREFCKDRPELKSIGMINPALDSVSNAIQQKNLSSFNRSFYFLTNTCNNCHKATNHGFNVVMIPTSLPVVNQDFKPAQKSF